MWNAPTIFLDGVMKVSLFLTLLLIMLLLLHCLTGFLLVHFYHDHN